MQDVLALLNIQVSYKERISQVENLMKQENHKELNLTVISSTLKYEQNTYVITPSGLKNSKRNANDGIVLFGYEKKSVIKKQNENINTDNNIYSNESLRNNNINTNNNDLDLTNVFTLNDFVFPVEEKEENVGLYEFPNFAIFYNLLDGNYYIKDFNTGVGALMKIKKMELDFNTLINIGSNYLVIYINNDIITFKIFNNSTVSDRKYNDDSIGQNYVTKEYRIKENEDSVITIGRSQKCDIIIEDMMLSKIQAYIEYNSKTKKFYLNDGDEMKESTNGTWVFILNATKITNNFMFKAEHTLFLATLNAIVPPAAAPITAPVIKPSNVNDMAKVPSPSEYITGLLPQYEYRFNPIILDESRYSIESGVINLKSIGL